ncbi:MAG TPA: nuclear transport factor 2 family protein [Acidimicrobiales bacterium]|jgi:ketosteroid isomerase-like protein|nr:nuclear transport factor 2 family protein [Acidimicrobiales bacterium]
MADQEEAEVAVVVAFNAAINRRDIEALGALMAEEHRFVDVEGHRVEGKAACVEAWRGFFASFPDYRNVFDDVRGDGAGSVEIRGRSECSDPALDGPARWHAEVRDGLVVLWQVTEG